MRRGVHAARSGSAAAVAALVCSLLLGGLPLGVAGAADLEMPGAPDEQEAYRLLTGDRPIKARELAEQILRRRPRSYAAHLVLGRYFHDQEANLPRALHHLRQAWRVFDKQCGDGERCGELAWRWRAQTLMALAFLAGDMDQRRQELHWLDLYEESYLPKRQGLRAWALMKLGRLSEARAVAQQGIEQGGPEEQESSWTTLCAIESEQQDFSRAYEICHTAARRVESDPGDGTVEFRNAGHSSFALFRFDEAERFFEEATRRPVASYSAPWADLASLLTQEGRLVEAAQALSEARRYVHGRPPAYVYNDRSRVDLVAADLLLALGQARRAYGAVQRALLSPDRLGGTSAKREQEEGGAALMVRATALTLARALDEQALGLPLAARPGHWLRRTDLRFAAWRAERRAASWFGSGELLVSTLRPAHPRGANCASWVLGDLTRIAGPGVVLEAVRRARLAERRPEARAYLDAQEAEARWLLGDDARAVTLARRAAQDLPVAELLLRARVTAVWAAAAGRRGDRATSLDAWERTMQADPGVLRRLGLALPVTLRSDGSPRARAALALLRDSPRLDDGQGGFVVEIEGSRICLHAPSGTVLGCATPPARPRPGVRPSAGAADTDADEDAPSPALDPPAALVRAFHEQLFAPALDLTQLDIRALDGSSTAGRPDDRALKSVLDRISW